MLVASPVRADRRAQYEQFIETVWTAGLRADSGWRHVRVLRPTEPNPDSTFTYVLVFDPAMPGGNPPLDEALRKLFPETEVQRLLQLVEGSLAGPPTVTRAVQSRY